jgi:hypothetical protein
MICLWLMLQQLLSMYWYLPALSEQFMAKPPSQLAAAVIPFLGQVKQGSTIHQGREIIVQHKIATFSTKFCTKFIFLHCIPLPRTTVTQILWTQCAQV